MNPQQRTKIHSLIGVRVLLITLDGVQIAHDEMVIEEISPYGLLFRAEKGQLIFASSAAFTTFPPKNDDE